MTAEPGQQWDPERYARHAGFVAELGRGVVALLDPRPGEREPLLREVRDAVAPALLRGDGAWLVDYVRLRFRAVRR